MVSGSYRGKPPFSSTIENAYAFQKYERLHSGSGLISWNKSRPAGGARRSDRPTILLGVCGMLWQKLRYAVFWGLALNSTRLSNGLFVAFER